MAKVTDKSLENVIGLLLRTGVLFAAAVVLAGAILYLLQSGGEHVRYSTFQPMSDGLTSVAGIFAGAVHLQAGAVIQLGVLLLIATPVARVALALVGFLLEHDYLYTVVSAIVLAVLIYSLAHTG
jgi:uncharacterized membrane protein